MIKKNISVILIFLCFVQCKMAYTTTIIDVNRKHRFTTSLSRENVFTYQTLRISLKGKEAYKLYKGYKKMIPKVYITDNNTVDVDYRTAVSFYKNKELIQTVFLVNKNLIVVGYTNKITHDSNYVKEVFKLINEN